MMIALIVEILLRNIPEIMILLYSIHLFARCKVHIPRYFLSTIILVIVSTVYDRLPVHYGVNTVMAVVSIIFCVTYINKMDIVKAVQGVIITSVLEISAEAINVLIIKYVFLVDTVKVFDNPVTMTIYGIPSLLIMILMLLVIKNSILPILLQYKNLMK